MIVQLYRQFMEILVLQNQGKCSSALKNNGLRNWGGKGEFVGQALWTHYIYEDSKHSTWIIDITLIVQLNYLDG